MSYQQAYTYWQHQRSSMASEASYQRFLDNHPNPNTNLTPSQQFQTYSCAHHVNLTGVHQSHVDMYDSLFPSDSSANSSGIRNTAEEKDNQTDYQGPAWTSTSHLQMTRLPVGVTTSEALQSPGVVSLHEGSLPGISQIMTQQPTHYTHHLQLESSSHSTCHQQSHQTIWRQQSQQLSDPQLPSLHPSNQYLLPRKLEGLTSASNDSTEADEHDQTNVSELTAPDAQCHSTCTSSTLTHPVSREPFVKKMANEMIYEEGASCHIHIIPNDDRNSGTPYKTQKNGCRYCKLCDVVCSGPLNLKMHLKGPKHKLNMLTKDVSCNPGAFDVFRNRYTRCGGFVPVCHNQNDRPIIGLDFVTRVVTPDAKDDTYECSLCGRSNISRRRVYLHVMAKSHRQAYIRKLKPDLAEQYCTVEDVYKHNEKLQKRESIDLAVLLNSIIKIAAKRDGPGQTHIRLSSERDCDVQEQQQHNMMDELETHCDLVDMHHDSQVDEVSDSRQSLHIPAKDDTSHCVTLQSNPSHQPSAQLTNQTKAPILARAQPSNESKEPSCLPSQAFSFEVVTPHHRTSSSDILSISTLQQQPSMFINQIQQDASRDVQSTPTMHSNVSQTMPSTAFSQISSMPLPMTDDQLRPYCSDVFISQEHQRRFGDSLMPLNNDHRSSESNSSISKVFAEGSRSVDVVLKSLSDPVVNSEEDAALAIELTRALTQATFKYRLRQKNFAGLESQGNK